MSFSSLTVWANLPLTIEGRPCLAWGSRVQEWFPLLLPSSFPWLYLVSGPPRRIRAWRIDSRGRGLGHCKVKALISLLDVWLHLVENQKIPVPVQVTVKVMDIKLLKFSEYRHLQINCVRWRSSRGRHWSKQERVWRIRSNRLRIPQGSQLVVETRMYLSGTSYGSVCLGNVVPSYWRVWQRLQSQSASTINNRRMGNFWLV